MNRMKNNVANLGICALVAFAATTGIYASCSSGSGTVPGAEEPALRDSGSDVSGLTDASASDGRLAADAREVGVDGRKDSSEVRCEKDELSALPGWRLNGDWSCACRMYDPLPGTALPEWGRWEKCPTLGPRNVDCRVIVPPPDYVVGGLGASVDVDESSGRIKFALIYGSPDRYNATRSTIFVFDADGPTLNAMIADSSPTGNCNVTLKGMNQGKVAVRVVGKDPNMQKDFSQQAVLGGNADGPLARLVYQWDPPPPDGWSLSAFASSDLLVTATRNFGRVAADWETMQWREIWERDPEGLMVSGTVVWGKNVFFGVNGGGLGGIMSWNPDDGLRPLLRRYGDRLEGTANFGTDGKDMRGTTLVRPPRSLRVFGLIRLVCLVFLRLRRLRRLRPAP
jgi:hypothetical protein